MAYISGTIRLTKDVALKTSQKGNQFSTGWGYMDIEGESGLGVSLIAFNAAGIELARYKKGDVVHCQGNLKENRWQPDKGEEVVGLQLIVQSVMGRKRINAIQNEQAPKKRETNFKPAHNNFNQLNDSLGDL